MIRVKVFVVTYSWDNGEAYEDHVSNYEQFKGVFSTREKAFNYIRQTYETDKERHERLWRCIKDEYPEDFFTELTNPITEFDAIGDEYRWSTCNTPWSVLSDHIFKIEEVIVDDNVSL